jgi:hypothetical protein
LGITLFSKGWELIPPLPKIRDKSCYPQNEDKSFDPEIGDKYLFNIYFEFYLLSPLPFQTCFGTFLKLLRVKNVSLFFSILIGV